MQYFSDYIEKEFSTELSLLILLSNENPKKTDVAKYTNNVDWTTFLYLCQKHRLVSHVYLCIDLIKDIIPQKVYEELRQAKLDQSAKSLHYTGFVLKIHQYFREHNISHCFFKGPILSKELYDDIGLRDFRDIDVLVNVGDVEKAKQIIEELGFKCVYPNYQFTTKQQKNNYSISHHYHFRHIEKNIDIELHWSITNPKSFFGKESSKIISESTSITVTNIELPYISKIDNLVFLAAHGAVHQWYRLFWLKDFSVLLSQTSENEFRNALKLSKNLKLENCFVQACQLSKLLYGVVLPGFKSSVSIKNSLISIPIKAIQSIELKQLGAIGKIRFMFYRLKLKPSLNYYFDLVFRLRTHLSDWNIIRLPDQLFFLYYLLRPFLLGYKFLVKNK